MRNIAVPHHPIVLYIFLLLIVIMWVPYNFIKLKRSRENAPFSAPLSTKPCQYRCVVQPGVELGYI